MSHLGLSDPWGTATPAVARLFPRGVRRLAGGKHCVYKVHEKSTLLPQVIDVLARAECGTTKTAPDPILDWVYAGDHDRVCAPLAAPPSPHRAAWFKWLCHFYTLFGCSRDGTYALVDEASGKVVAAAVTQPPRTVKFACSFEEMGINLRKAEGGMAFAQVILANSLRMKTLTLCLSEME